MQTRDIGIVLLIGLLILGVIGAGIPYTTSQFIWQSTDLNYTKFYAGEYDGNGLIIDGNTFTIYDLNDLNNSSNYINEIDLNVIWNDNNKDYGTIYCPDGNVVSGCIGSGCTAGVYTC